MPWFFISRITLCFGNRSIQVPDKPQTPQSPTGDLYDGNPPSRAQFVVAKE